MKKILLFVTMMLLAVSVNASSKPSTKEIKVENVKIEIADKVSYDGEVKVNYSINPKDAKNLNLVWSVKTKSGVKVEIDNKNTNTADGTITLKVSNTNKNNSSFTISAKQGNKEFISKKVVVESETESVKRITEEVNALIDGLETDINKDNYEEIKENVNKIEEMLKDEKVKEQIKEESLTKYEEVKTSVNEYKPSNNLLITIITIVLIIIFTGLLFWIFNKED